MTVDLCIPFWLRRLLAPGLILGLTILAQICSSVAYATASDNKNPSRFALIVGVAEVPGLPQLQRLQGIGNDVKSMRALAERFGIHRDKLRVLSDTGAAIAPTYAAIVAGLRWVEESAVAGDQVLVYFAGHGGQQPENISENRVTREADGLDEIFFASDARPWDDAVGSAPNVLTDNALRRWLEYLHTKGVAVWLIVDMCHAGTFSRGGHEFASNAAYDIVAYRGASLADIGIDLSAPRWKVLSMRARASLGALTGRQKGQSSREYRDGVLSNVTAFYATDEDGQAAEVKAKRGGDGVHGLFTLFLTEEANRLLESRASKSVASYRLLMQRILARYRRDMAGLIAPTFEGVDAGAWFRQRLVKP